MSQFNDRVTASSTVRRTSEGYLVTTAKVARSGVQDYLGSEVGRPEMATVRMYRPESEVFSDATMHSFAHRPMTLEHPSQQVDSKNWREVAIGNTGGKVYRDGDYIVVDLVMMDQKAIAAYEAGKRELSMGYDAEIEFTSGTTPSGEKYDAIQRKIRNNHLALVGSARGGAALRVGDNQAPMMDAGLQALLDQASPGHFRDQLQATHLGGDEIAKIADQMSANVRSGTARIAKAQEDAARVQAHADAYMAKHAAQQAVRDNGYSASLAAFDRTHKEA